MIFFIRNILVLVSVVLQLTNSKEVRAQAFNFQELSIQQGLPQSQAYAIIFDSTQHAWIGTQGGGLCRYDGSGFDYFSKNDSLISNAAALAKTKHSSKELLAKRLAP